MWDIMAMEYAREHFMVKDGNHCSHLKQKCCHTLLLRELVQCGIHRGGKTPLMVEHIQVKFNSRVSSNSTRTHV